MNYKIDYSLYLVTDREVLKGRDLISSLEVAILGGVTLIQLREKDISSLDFYNIAVKVKELTDKYSIPLIVNDRIDVAMAIDAAGVHLGQSDFPCRIARKIMGTNKLVGISAGTLEEAMLAEKQGADYIGVGAIFQTGTKLDAKTVGIDVLTDIKRGIKIPVVAIGGINEKNYSLLKDTGIEGVAIISAILGKDNIREAAEIFKMNKIKI